MHPLPFALGFLWTAPNTLLGLVAGLVAVPFGARPYRVQDAIAFRCMPCFSGALTLGCVILHAGLALDVAVPTYAGRACRSPTPCVCLADHERAHVRQYFVLGPLFLPVYFLCGGVSARNPFERAADRFALTGAGWWPWPRR